MILYAYIRFFLSRALGGSSHEPGPGPGLTRMVCFFTYQQWRFSRRI